MKRYSGVYKALVVEGSDPKKMGRVKVRVKGIHDGLPNDALPWAMGTSQTAVAGGGSFFEPAKDSKVSVRFLEGDINFPVWTGGVFESSADMPKNLKPGRFILYESPKNGIVITVNDDLKDIEIKTDKYNTTLGAIIDAIIQHTHMTPAGASGNSGTGVPPIIDVNFKQGTLQ